MMKGKRTISISLVVIMVFSGFNLLLSIPDDVIPIQLCIGSNASFAGGNGTVSNPYQISNVTQLQNMSADLTAHYILINDINASATINWNGGKGFKPVGDVNNRFSGSLHGQEKNITGLFINRSSEDYIGLFGFLSTGTTIFNISIVDNNVTGRHHVGGLVGDNYNDATISNCYATGEVSGRNCVGGLVGIISGTVSNCYAIGNVSGNDAVGGLVGFIGGTISNCYAIGNVSGGGEKVGGLLGGISGTMSDCSAIGNVSGNDKVGGLVGQNSGTVSNCSASGNVIGVSRVGGLVGWNMRNTVVNCYATGNVSGTFLVGGLVGQIEDGMVNNSYYCINTTTVNSKQYLTQYGLYEVQYEDWMDNDRSLDIDDYLLFDSGSGYYNISNSSDIKNMLPFAASGNYEFKQRANIDLSSEPGLYIPVLEAGIFDGNGYSISNLNVTFYDNDRIGMFGYIGSEVILRNISILNNNLSGYYRIGGLLGYNKGSVLNCYTNGNVNGGNAVGGLVGHNYYDATISNCYATGMISGHDYIGGLVGYNYEGTVFNCYATGNVSGNEHVGGFVGWNRDNMVSNCSATGNVSGNDYIGGLVGYNLFDGTVFNCSATGNVDGRRFVGGIMGYNYEGSVFNCSATGNVNGDGDYTGGLIGGNSGIVSSCYSIGDVDGYDRVGGLVGDNRGRVSSCYSIGDVDGYDRVGGLVGRNYNRVSNSYTTGNVSGYDRAGGLVGSNMHGKVSNCTATGNVIGGSGLVGINDEGTISDCVATGNVNGGSGLVGINNKGTISNCNATGNVSGQDSVGGLVGSNDEGDVFNCYATGNVNGTGDCIGGLVGYNMHNTVLNCYATGKVSGNNYIGGLVGYNYDKVSNCYATGVVNGNNSIGGLVGYNSYGTVSNSYATGNVSGNNSIGGLVGSNSYGTVSNSYATGNVSGNNSIGGLVGSNSFGTVSNSFWDLLTSGLSISNGGSGKDTYEMMTKSTFISVEWDFSTVWNIIDGDSYPYLRSLYYRGIPKIITDNIEHTYEDDLYYVDYNATSSLPRGLGAFWNFTTNAGDWLTILKGGILTGTPSNNDVGIYWVNISASWKDDGYSFSNFTLTVHNINDPPIITTDPIYDVFEDQPYRVNFVAHDEDPTMDICSWSLKTSCSSLSMNKTTGNLSGIPLNSDVGSHWVNVTVSDGNGGSDWNNYTLIVYNTNDDPLITTIDLPEVKEDEFFSVILKGEDIDSTHDKLEWGIKTDASFIDIDPLIGNLSGLPTNDDVGTWWILVNVSDGIGGFDEMNLTLEVLNVNDDPEIYEFDIPTIHEDISFFLDLEAYDIDPTDDELEWELRTNAHFIDIAPSTGNLTGTPSNDDVGTWWINVSVSDGNGGSDRRNFTLTVLNVNDVPQLNITELTLTMDEDSNGTSIELREVFFDVDGDVLSYDHEDSNNLTISVEGGTVMITPDPDWCGTEIIKFTASDGSGSISINVTIDVKPINDAPTDVKIIAESVYDVGSNQIVDSSANDVDISFGDELTFLWSSNISGEIGEGKSINLSLPVGHHLITLTVTDKEGLSATATMEIKIKPITEETGNGGDGIDDLPLALILIIAIIALVLIIVLVIFILIRKKGKDAGLNEEEMEQDTGHVEETITVEEQSDDMMQQVQSPEEVNDPEMGPPMAETSFPEMNVNDDQYQAPLDEEQMVNDIPMESDVIPTENEEQVFQDSPENPFLEESEDLIS